LVGLHGFGDKCASVRSVAIPILELETGTDAQAKRSLEEAQKAAEGDGADVIVLGCGSILALTEEISALGVPVVVPEIAARKLCEDLIAMQLAQSKRCFSIPTRGSKEPA